MQTKPIIVQLVHEPPKEVTVGDVLLGAFGLTGALILFSLVLAGLFAIVLVRRNRRRPPELDRPPSMKEPSWLSRNSARLVTFRLGSMLPLKSREQPE